jgi:small subunit ribosomal protein S7
MPRRREVPKRDILPDPKFGSQDVAKFVNVLMMSGKKSVAEKHRLSTPSTIIKEQVWQGSARGFQPAVNNVKPMVEVKSRRVGGANYQVPVEVRPACAVPRWPCAGFAKSARKRSEKSMGARLAGELMEAAEGRGGAVKKREEVHRMAEANKAFAHYRF